MTAEETLAKVNAEIERRRIATHSIQVRWFCDSLLSFIAALDKDDELEGD